MDEMDRFDQYENHGCEDEEPKFRCTVCGRIGSVGRCCGVDSREPLNDAARAEYLADLNTSKRAFEEEQTNG